MPRFYVTTPIYYVNDKPHIGHAYTTIIADCLARFKRQDGYDVFFQTGTDEHGVKIERASKERGITPREMADQVVVHFIDAWKRLDISYDNFIRTTDPDHERRVKLFYEKLVENNAIYKGEYTGWYSASDEAFLTENQITEDKKSIESGKPVELVSEESYFLKMSAYQDKLLDYIKANPDCIAPATRKNEVTSFVSEGLRDLSVSRATVSWGVPVPNDPKHTIYVWIDALSNYITSLGYPDDMDKFNHYWPVDVHLIGKDIIRFHSVYWPIMLMAAGIDLPKQVFAHGWWRMGGEKMSKSDGNVVDPIELIDEYGPDPVRYFVLREIPPGADGDFTMERFIDRFDIDLANDLGNLVHRSLSMLKKYNDAVVPGPGPAEGPDDELREMALGVLDKVRDALEKRETNTALESIWEVVRRTNKYIEESAPWTLNKEGRKDRLNTVLYNILEMIRISAVMITPFLPQTGPKIIAKLGLDGDEAHAPFAEQIVWGRLQAGARTELGDPLFPRIQQKTGGKK